MTFAATYIALWCVAVFSAIVAFGLVVEIRQRPLRNASVNRPLEGQTAPSMSAYHVASGVHSRIVLSNQHLILFVSPDCDVCHRLLAFLRTLKGLAPRELVLLCGGRRANCEEFARIHAGPHFNSIFIDGGEIRQLYGVSAIPTAVVVESSKVLRYGEPKSDDELLGLWTPSAMHGSVWPPTDGRVENT